MAQGVFSLIEVRTEQVSNIANNDFASWPEVNNYGYFFSASPQSAVCRLNFSDETGMVLQNANLFPNQSNTYIAAVVTPQYMFVGGGSKNCTISRLDLSSEIFSLPGSNFTTWRQNLASVSNDNYGYFGGGDNAPVYYSNITKLDFSNETVTDSPIRNLPSARSAASGLSNNSYGYFAGGDTAPTTSICDINRIDFSTETVGTPGKNLLAARDNLKALEADSYAYGYFTAGGPAQKTNIYKLDFSSETITEITPIGSSGSDKTSSTSSSSTGYLTLPGSGDPISKLNFSTNTITSGSINSGWGNQTFTSSNIQGSKKIAQETPKTYGYFVGGTYSNPTPPPNQLYTGLVDRLNFSTETVSSPGNSITAKTQFASFSNNEYGYVAGGLTPPATPNVICSIDRIDFSSETVTTNTQGLPSSRSDSAGTSSNSYGYFGGGGSPSILSTISRLDFSNQIITDIPTKFPTVARSVLAAVSSNSYGYFGGGISGGASPTFICTISRLDFSNETINDLPLGLPSARRSLAGTSSNSYGYFGGGETSPTSFINTITKCDFSNETISNLPAGLTIPVSRLAGASSNSYGYFGGGGSPLYISTIIRLNFSTETSNILPASLSLARYYLSAVSNSN